eukprot:7388239-Prymnesium_polylepis.1
MPRVKIRFEWAHSGSSSRRTTVSRLPTRKGFSLSVAWARLLLSSFRFWFRKVKVNSRPSSQPSSAICSREGRKSRSRRAHAGRPVFEERCRTSTSPPAPQFFAILKCGPRSQSPMVANRASTAYRTSRCAAARFVGCAIRHAWSAVGAARCPTKTHSTR